MRFVAFLGLAGLILGALAWGASHEPTTSDSIARSAMGQKSDAGLLEGGRALVSLPQSALGTPSQAHALAGTHLTAQFDAPSGWGGWTTKVWLAPVDDRGVPDLSASVLAGAIDSNPSGQFAATVKVRGQHMLIVEHPTYLPFGRVIDVQDKPIDLGRVLLEEGSTLRGIVTLNGKDESRVTIAYGVPGAAQRTTSLDVVWRDGALVHGLRYANLNFRNTFELSGLQPGPLVITVVNIGWKAQVESLDVRFRCQTVLIPNTRSFQIDVLAAELGVDFEEAAAQTPWDPKIVVHSASGMTEPRWDDDYEHRRFWLLPNEAVRLVATWPTGYVEEREVLMGDAGTSTDVSLRPPPATAERVRIRIRDSLGAAVAGAIIDLCPEGTLRDWQHTCNRRFSSDSDGYMHIHALLPGTYKLSFRHFELQDRTSVPGQRPSSTSSLAKRSRFVPCSTSRRTKLEHRSSASVGGVTPHPARLAPL